MSPTSLRNSGDVAVPSQFRRSAAWMARKPSGGSTASIRTGISTRRLRPSAASSWTHSDATAAADQSTSTHPASPRALSITSRQVLPAGISRSHHTGQP